MIEIPKFKVRSLERLRASGEPQRVYPIAAGDLISASACPLCGSERISWLTVPLV